MSWSSRAAVVPRDAVAAVLWEPVEVWTRAPAPPESAGDAAADPALLAAALAAAGEAREAEAEAERERIRAEARAEGRREGFAEGREAGRAEGYAAGREEGRVEGEAAEGLRLRAAVQAAERALADVRAGEERWAGKIEENVCALAVAVARQVIGREVRADAAVIADMVRRALAEFPIDQPVRIRVHPLDLGAMTTAVGSDGAPLTITGEREASWVADASIDPGGCLVEGRDRIVDGRIDAALERVYRRLTHSHV
jgi:flagellar assembly protein FliH